MSGCKPSHESDTVCVLPAKSSVITDRIKIDSGGCNDRHQPARFVHADMGADVRMGGVILSYRTFRTLCF